MNRINQLFSKNPQKLLSLYFCAGAPVLGNTAEIIKTLEKKGVGMIEIGIPFSDPMADGPIIQSATTKALKNGMSLKKLFAQLENIRESVNIPLVMMGCGIKAEKVRIPVSIDQVAPTLAQAMRIRAPNGCPLAPLNY